MVKWGERKLETLLLLHDSGTWGQPATPQNGLPILRSTNIQTWELTLKTDIAYRNVPNRDRERKRLGKGDIIVTKSSGSPHLIGEAALFDLDDTKGSYLFSNFTLRLRPNPHLIAPQYLHYYLRSPKARSVIAEMHRTTSGLRNLQITEYLSQPVVLPCSDEPERSLAEQRRIVARIEALLAEVREIRKLQAEVTANCNNGMCQGF
jgi:type I restriction enzyme, S subunit